MTNKMGSSRIAIALVSLATLASAVACGSDDKNSGTATAGQPGTGSSANSTGSKNGDAAGASSDSSGGTSNSDPIDYTTCKPVTNCDASAKVDFDFSGSWNESLVFTSNDCDPSLQPLLPPGFEMKDTIFTDVVIGNCFRMDPGSDAYSGFIATDLSEADYCATRKYPAGNLVGDVDLISHTQWTSIKTDKITGKSHVYAVQAGCTLVGDYTLTRQEK